MQGHRQVFLGNHQIAVLDASAEAVADGPGCTAENHCYYAHAVMASFGKSSRKSKLCGLFALGNQTEETALIKWKRKTGLVLIFNTVNVVSSAICFAFFFSSEI